MELFDFIASSDQELHQLKERRSSLQGRRAGTDPYSKAYRLISEELKQVEMQLAYKEREVSKFVEANC